MTTEHSTGDCNLIYICTVYYLHWCVAQFTYVTMSLYGAGLLSVLFVMLYTPNVLHVHAYNTYYTLYESFIITVQTIPYLCVCTVHTHTHGMGCIYFLNWYLT